MNIYDYRPPRKNKKATGVTIILFSLAAGLFLFTMLFPTMPFRWAVQLLAIAAFVSVVFIITRYVSKGFLYSIIKTEDDTLDLTVTEITNAGRSQITVCRISINNLESTYLLDRSIKDNAEKISEIEKAAKKEGRKSFNYCPDINPTEICILLGEECGEKYLVKLTPDSTLWSYLKK